MTKRVALLVGGWSAERQVSLEKGKAVEAALRAGGYDVDVIDVKQDLEELAVRLSDPKPDVVFNNLHGRGGEDGTIQGVLEVLEIPYTHSGVAASAIGMNKAICKNLASSFGVRCAGGFTTTLDLMQREGHLLEPPYVVKPVSEGSSVGIRIVMDRENQMPYDEENWAFGDEVLVERYIGGKELTVAVLDGKAQAVTEIISHTRFFDYEAKYHDTRTELVLPAAIPENIYKTALDYAERVYNGIGCAGLARCDFRYDDTLEGEDGLYFLEINTQPGLTAESIGPSQVVYNGMSFVELCSHLVETAKCHGKTEPQKSLADAAQKLKTDSFGA